MSRVLDVSRFSITAEDLQMSQFVESEHPRGQPENAGEFASKSGGGSGEKGKQKLIDGQTKIESVDTVNRWTRRAASAIGCDELDLYDRIDKAGIDPSDYPSMVRFLKDLYLKHDEGPKEWEPDDWWIDDGFDPSSYDTPEIASKMKEKFDAYVARRNSFRDALASQDNIPLQQKKQYLESIQRVLINMTTAGLRKMQKSADCVFYRNLPSLKAGVAPGESINGTVGGCWQGTSKNKGILHLDGGYNGKDANTSRDGIYAHEFAHSIDFDDNTNREISKSDEWQQAWGDEILDTNNLSEYAKTASYEGFAEFGRLVYSGSILDARDMFPKCFAVFKKHGLV